MAEKFFDLSKGRQLGEKNARLVMEAMSKDPNRFGFIKAEEKWLSELRSTPCPPGMQFHSDVFTFRPGIWVVEILVHHDPDKSWVEVHLRNPYDFTGVEAITSSL